VPPVELSLYQFAGGSQWATASGAQVRRLGTQRRRRHSARRAARSPSLPLAHPLPQAAGPSKYCDAKVRLRDRSPSSSSGDYKTFDISLAEFGCKPDVIPNKLDVLMVPGSGWGSYRWCMDDVKLVS
jgi:hypothetical protein